MTLAGRYLLLQALGVVLVGLAGRALLDAGVPLQCDEPADFRSYRIGLFGFDKLVNIDHTVSRLIDAFDQPC